DAIEKKQRQIISQRDVFQPEKTGVVQIPAAILDRIGGVKSLYLRQAPGGLLLRPHIIKLILGADPLPVITVIHDVLTGAVVQVSTNLIDKICVQRNTLKFEIGTESPEYFWYSISGNDVIGILPAIGGTPAIQQK